MKIKHTNKIGKFFSRILGSLPDNTDIQSITYDDRTKTSNVFVKANLDREANTSVVPEGSHKPESQI